MAILIRAVLPDVTTEQYDEFSAKLRAEAGDTFAGCLVHVCVAKDSGLEIYDLWESEEAMDRFAKVMTLLAEREGFAASAARPEEMPVHRYDFPSR
jgi:hypothetical protein